MIRKYAEIFCWKNVSSFCSAKATHIFSAKNTRILYIEFTKTVNEMTLNDVVKLTTLWTTGPWSCNLVLFILSVSDQYDNKRGGKQRGQQYCGSCTSRSQTFQNQNGKRTLSSSSTPSSSRWDKLSSRDSNCSLRHFQGVLYLPKIQSTRYLNFVLSRIIAYLEVKIWPLL